MSLPQKRSRMDRLRYIVTQLFIIATCVGVGYFGAELARALFT